VQRRGGLIRAMAERMDRRIHIIDGKIDPSTQPAT
jgi:hypothetical protein